MVRKPLLSEVGSQLFFARKLFDSPAANRLRAALDRRARQRWKWVEVGASIAGEWEWRGGVCDGVVQHAWSAMAAEGVAVPFDPHVTEDRLL